MSDKKNIRGYHRSSKAWYCHSVPGNVSVMFGIYDANGEGCIGEMEMEWVELDGSYPQLKCFEDSWATLASFSDLLPLLAKVNDKHISEPYFAQMLDACGFKDLTQYENKDAIEPKEPMIDITIPVAKAKKIGLIK